MPVGHRTSTVSSIVPLTSNEYGVELNSTRRHSDNHNIDSKTSSSNSNEKSNPVTNQFLKIVKEVYSTNIETRGIERISTEDRTDLKIINTAMIWVRYILF